MPKTLEQPKQKEESWRTDTNWFQGLVYKATEIKTVCYRVSRETQTSVEQNRQPRKRFTIIRSIDIWQRNKGNTMEKEESFHQKVLEQLDIHMQNDGPQPISFTLHTINSKQKIHLNIKPKAIKLCSASKDAVKRMKRQDRD